MREGWELWDFGTVSSQKMLLISPTCHRKGMQKHLAFDALEGRKNFPALKTSQLLHSCFPHLLNGRANGGRQSNRKLSDSCVFSPESEKLSELGSCT